MVQTSVLALTLLVFTTAGPGRIPFGGDGKASWAVREGLVLQKTFAPQTRLHKTAAKAVEFEPESAIGHYLLGIASWGDEAKGHMKRAGELAPKAPEAERRFIEAALSHRDKKYDEAIAILDKLRAEYPNDPYVLTNLGDAHQAKGDLAKAEEALAAAALKDPRSARAHSLLGSVLLRREAYARGRKHYETARANVARDAAPIGVWFGLAQSYVYEGQGERALATLNDFLPVYRTSPISGLPETFIWNSMARIHLELGDAQAALGTYEKGFESVTKAELPERQRAIWTGRLHHGRGRALARLGKHDEAKAEAEKLKALIEGAGSDGKEFLPAYHYLAGYLELEAGKTDAAIEHLKQADPNDPFHVLLLARAYEKAGRKDDSREAYKKIIDSHESSLERALAYPEAKKKLS